MNGEVEARKQVIGGDMAVKVTEELTTDKGDRLLPGDYVNVDSGGAVEDGSLVLCRFQDGEFILVGVVTALLSNMRDYRKENGDPKQAVPSQHECCETR